MRLSVCPSGHANEPRWRYCIECGTLLPSRAAQAPADPAPAAPSTSSEQLTPIDTVGDADEHRRQYLIALAVLIVALAVAGTTLALVLRQRSSVLASNELSTRSSHKTGATTPNGDPRTAAVAVNRLLVASEANRSSVQQAVGQIASCSDVAGATHSLQVAAVDREQLIIKLGGLDLSALPTSMVDDLTSSWLNSLDSDISYARWGQDENRGACAADDYSNSNYQAAIGTDGQASTSKGAFLTLWDPLAQSNGLPQWQASQI